MICSWAECGEKAAARCCGKYHCFGHYKMHRNHPYIDKHEELTVLDKRVHGRGYREV